MNTKNKAVILAAGRSSRLYPITKEKPKCLLEIGNKKIIQRQIDALREIGIDDILVVVGYKGDAIVKEVGNQVRCRKYNDFEKTNNLHTLWSIRDELRDGFFCLFSDVIFDVEIIKRADHSREDFCMIIDTSKVLKGTMGVRILNEKLIQIDCHTPSEKASGNFIGIAKFSKAGSELLLEQMSNMVSGYLKDYYTMAINILMKKGVNIGYVDIAGLVWAEIDTQEDLNKAKQIFVAPAL